MIKTLLLFLSAGFLSVTISQDVGENSGKFSGLTFGDYYYVVKNHDKSIKDQHGFWFRRIYFTYDYTVDEDWSARLRLEMSNKGDFQSNSTIVPVVKDAWLRYKFSNQSVYLGITGTPTFALIEDTWGYRSVEKVPVDLYKMGSSKDFGIALKGKIGPGGILNYHAMYSNGNGNKQEIDKGKAGMLAFSVQLKNGLIFEVYGDYADQPNHTDTYILQGFVAYKSDLFRVGIQFTNQWIQQTNADKRKLGIISGFATRDISKCFSLLLRGDRSFDANPKADGIDFIPFDPTAKFTLIIFGIDFHPVKNVKIIPNIEFAKYDKNSVGITPGDDLFARITYYWSFD
jgi:hypothetical protein